MECSLEPWRIRPRLSRIVLVAFVVSFRSSDADAFCAPVGNAMMDRRNGIAFHSNSRSKLYAKRPPTSNFDLSEIEKFEHELETVYLEVDPDAAYDYLEQLDAVDDNDDADNVRTYTIPEEFNNKRIDAVISALEPSLSRSHCGNLVTDGHVRLVSSNNQSVVVDRKSFKVESGMTLQVTHPKEEQPTEVIAQDLPLSILYEDEHMIVLNKQNGMVCHPAAGNRDGTVVNALAYYLAYKSPFGSGDFIDKEGKVVNDDVGAPVDGADRETVSFRPGIVHRLDKGTTGVLVVAKTKAALAALSEAFATRSVKKTYLAVTVGNPGKRVVIDKPIGRHPIHRQRMRVVPDPHKKNSSGMAPKDRLLDLKTSSQAGRRALSFVNTLAFDGKLSLAQIRIETGRTHQIRVHLQDRRSPIYGDDIYGLTDWNKKLSKTHSIERPLLHAHKLELCHPVTSERMVFCAPMADDMLRVARAIWPQGKDERPDLFSVANGDNQQ